MSTIVVVRKNGKACIAADSLTTFGDLRMGSEFDRAYDKVQAYEDGREQQCAFHSRYLCNEA